MLKDIEYIYSQTPSGVNSSQRLCCLLAPSLLSPRPLSTPALHQLVSNNKTSDTVAMLKPNQAARRQVGLERDQEV